MRIRSILMLASVAMVLIAAGVGNAFAATYSGTDKSELMDYSSSSYVKWNQQINQDLDVNVGNSLSWANNLKNNKIISVNSGVEWSSSDSGLNSGASWGSINAFGTWSPTTTTASINSISGNPTLTVKHDYYRFDSGFEFWFDGNTQGQKYH